MWPAKHHFQVLPVRCGARSTRNAPQAGHLFLPLLQQPLAREQLQHHRPFPDSRRPPGTMDLLDRPPPQPGAGSLPREGPVLHQVLRLRLWGHDSGRGRFLCYSDAVGRRSNRLYSQKNPEIGLGGRIALIFKCKDIQLDQ